MSKEKLFHVGTKAIIENEEGKILLLHVGERPGLVNKNYWDIPGGRIQEGQTVTDTLKREIKEETGIAGIGKADYLGGFISHHEYEQGGQNFGLVLVVYKVNVLNVESIALSEEHTDYEWVDKKEAAERLSHKYPPEFTKLLI